MNKNSVIISDTSPLIYLMKINQLDILGKLYDRVFIPRKVFEELTSNPQYPKEAYKIKNAFFIVIANVKDEEAVKKFIEKSKIDQGESEAIVLAKELNISQILLEDKRAKFIAKKISLKVLNCIKIFSEAYKKEIIDDFDLEQIYKIACLKQKYLPQGFAEDLLSIPEKCSKGFEP